MSHSVRGLFIAGADTEVGKTHVGALIARRLAAAGHRVGVYKPAESGCELEDGRLMPRDAWTLWQAAVLWASSTACARSDSPRRWRRVWPRPPRGASLIDACSPPGSTTGSTGAMW